jgi:hypothetical protein
MILTKHEGATFQNQTIYISGQAFVRCNFVACTLVLRETLYHMENCSFERCNWHVDRVIMWGSPESVREIKALIAMIEQAQLAQMPAGNPGANATMNADPRQMPPISSPISSIPPLTAGMQSQRPK